MTPDDDDLEHHTALEGAEWAFYWAIVTICAVALAALAGWAWRAWPWW